MNGQRLPPLSQLYDDWRVQGRFFFVRKFLEESRRSSVAAGALAVVAPTHAKARFWSRVGAPMLERLRALAGFLVLVARAVFAPKGKVLIFNHTKRVRRSGDVLRPLYLSQALDLEGAIVFEDAPAAYPFAGPVRSLQSSVVTRASEISSAIVARLGGRRDQSDRDIANFFIARAFWRLVFRLLRPRCIRLFVWYGKEAVVAAGKSLGIDVADVQHGIIYPSHPFYNVKAAQEGCGYLLPDRCLVYGEYWRSLLVRSGWQPSQVDVVGYFVDTKPCHWTIPQQPYILYTSQPHTSASICEHIRSILPQVHAMGYQVFIAPHPAEPAGLYDNVLGESVRIAAGWDSYDLLRHCAVHVSVSSTLLWEAIVFDKSSYVLDYGRDAVDLLSDFVGYGYGRTLTKGAFPHPFPLPSEPPPGYVFAPVIDKLLLSDAYPVK